tara:strand:- start:1523 stop:2863 length:1341 start_codon:yes stop_codon:yes gene_type:complete
MTSQLNINDLTMYPLMLSDTNILPCINRCFFEKEFIPIKNIKININDKSSLHINVSDNKSNIKLDGNTYYINDIIITFPGITQLNNHLYNGEILFIFFDSKNNNKIILSSLLSIHNNEHSSLCSAFMNELNIEIDKNSNSRNININNISELDITDLMPVNNTFYTYKYSDKIIWYVYQHPLNIFDGCVSNLIKIIKNNTNIDKTHGFNKEIFKYIDLKNVNNSNKCIINITNDNDNTNCNNKSSPENTKSNNGVLGNFSDIISTDITQYSIYGNIILYIVNAIIIIIGIICMIVFRNSNNALKNILIIYSIFIILLLILYDQILNNNIIFKIVNYNLCAINILICVIFFMVYINKIRVIPILILNTITTIKTPNNTPNITPIKETVKETGKETNITPNNTSVKKTGKETNITPNNTSVKKTGKETNITPNNTSVKETVKTPNNITK